MHQRRGLKSGGPEDHFFVSGLKIIGCEKAGRRSLEVPASRTRLPATETDWMGKLRAMNDEWRRQTLRR